MNEFRSPLLFAVLLCFASTGFGQDSSGSTDSAALNSAHLIWLLPQGEKLEISQDFTVRLDQRRLRIALANREVLDIDASEDLVVALIQPGREVQKQRVSGQQPIIFEDVQDGLSSLVVMGVDRALQAQSVAYAAFAFFAESAAGGPPAMVAAAEEPLQVPLAVVSTSQIRKQLSQVSTQVHIADINTLEEYVGRPRNHFRVMRTVSGSLVGRFHIPENQFRFSTGQVQVTVLRNSEVYASTVSRPDGRFEIPNIEPGFYSMFAVGRNGHAAFSFEVVDREEEALNLPDFETTPVHQPVAELRFVSYQLNVPAQLNVLLIPPSLMNQVLPLIREQYGFDQGEDALAAVAGGVGAAGAGQDESSPAPPFAPPRAAGGGSGGGGGGGGAGGGGLMRGGTGMAAFAGLAGLAGLSGLAGDDDGFNASIPTPVLP
jgi:hypothetical protein